MDYLPAEPQEKPVKVIIDEKAEVLEWVAISFSRSSSLPRDRTRVSRIIGRRLIVWATREVIIDEKKDLKSIMKDSILRNNKQGIPRWSNG